MSSKYYGNEKYYLDTFERLDAVGKNTRNWSAFFFGPCWLVCIKLLFVEPIESSYSGIAYQLVRG